MMKIESVREPSVRGGRFTAVLDTGAKLRLERSTVEQFALFAGRELTEEELEKIRTANAKASAKARAVRILSASSVSSADLRRRLVEKGETEENADEAVAWLQDLKLLDDLETARQLARNAARKGYGEARIRDILYRKGIDRELWSEAMEGLPSPDGAIDEFLAQRFRGQRPDRAEIKRASDALLRRGHRWSDIKPALRRYTDGLDDEWEE